MERGSFSAVGRSFSVHEWRGSGPATLHLHHSDHEGWHVLEGELHLGYNEGAQVADAGTTVFVPAGKAHTYTAEPGARYLLAPRLSALTAALQADCDPAYRQEIYQRFDSELFE